MNYVETKIDWEIDIFIYQKKNIIVKIKIQG